MERAIDKKRKCLLAVVSLSEAVFFQQNLIEIAKEYESYEHVICLLDDEEYKSQIGEPGFWKTVCARDFFDEPFLDKAFFFTKEEFTSVCHIKCLASLISEYDVVFSIHPRAFDSLKELMDCEVEENTIIIPVDRSILSIDALPNTGQYGYVNNDVLIISNGEGVNDFLSWCEKKIEYIQRVYNGYFFPIRLNYNQFSILQNWIYYAVNFNLNIDLSLSIPGHNKLTDIPTDYKYDCFANGVKISPFLRENYLRNYRLRRRCGNDPFLSWEQILNESDIVNDSFPVPLTPIMNEIFYSRTDLVAVFGNIKNNESRYAYTNWFLSSRDTDSMLKDLDDAYFTAVSEAMKNCNSELKQYSNSKKMRLRKKARDLLSMNSLQQKQSSSANKLDGNLPNGVNLCGFINGSFGLGEAMRTIASILDAGGIPFTIVDFQVGSHWYNEMQWDHKVSNEFIYNTNIILTAPNWLSLFMESVDPSSFANRYNIAYWFWELSEFPKEWLHEIDLIDEIWTASGFQKNTFQSATKKPVMTIPLSITMDKIATLTRKDFGIEEDAFVFLMTYDPYSISERKNPEGAIEAFKKVFDEGERVRLIVKFTERISDSNEDIIVRTAENTPNIDIIEGVFPKEKMNALIQCCDSLVSLHRAEGFGLTPAEAMYLGKPVVITNWSGNTEFIRNDNCCPVDYDLIKLEKDCPPYSKGDFWADPYVEHAAAYMKRLVEDHDYYETISKNARETMHTRFSTNAIVTLVKDRLHELNLIQ